MRILTVLFQIAALAYSVLAGAQLPLAGFGDATKSSLLPAGQYVTVEVNHLKKAKVLWVNWELLNEYGISIPAEGLTPDFEKSLLETFAWSVKGAGQNSLFTDQSKILFADIYGGEGRGTNLGSGRAASYFGDIPVQAKGVGPTSLVREKKDHANGALPLAEATREATFGEINNKQLPFGANRVLLILDRGTKTKNAYGETLSDAIVIRQDPVRPAHFMNLELHQKEISAQEILRSLEKSWGLNSGTIATKEDLKKFLIAYSDRLAFQYARAFVGLKLYHGATSESNIEITGRYIDYGTETAQPDHGQVKILEHLDPAGQMDQIRQMLIRNFSEQLTGRLDFNWEEQDTKLMVDRFNSTYQRNYRNEFLRLLGWPKHIAESISETISGQNLADLLAEIATEGATPYIGRYLKEDHRGTKYDFPLLVEKLITMDLRNPQLVQNIVSTLHMERDMEKVKKIASLFLALHKKAIGIAATEGISQINLEVFMVLSSRLKNKVTPGLYRWNMIKSDQILIQEFEKTQNASLVQKSIDDKISENLKYIEVQDPWTLVLSEKTVDPLRKQRSEYNARNGQIRTHSIVSRNPKASNTSHFMKPMCRAIFL